MNNEFKSIQYSINSMKEKDPESVGYLSDTFHTFNELYHHRTTLLALLLQTMKYSWKSKLHEDGTMYDDMFIVGVPTPDGMITYHCDIEYWNLFRIPELPHAPKFDGHTPDDVLKRLENYIMQPVNKKIYDENVEKIASIAEKEILPVFDDPIDQASFITYF